MNELNEKISFKMGVEFAVSLYVGRISEIYVKIDQIDVR